MKSESAIDRDVQRIRGLRSEKGRLEALLRKTESMLRECLFEAREIIDLIRKFDMEHYMDDELEVYGKSEITVKLTGKTILVGKITPKQGGWHVVIEVSKPDVIKKQLKSKLSKVKGQLEKRLSQVNKAKMLAEEERTILNRAEIKKRLDAEVAELKSKLREMGAR